MTARKYGVDPSNMHCWKENLEKDEAAEAKTRHRGKLGTVSQEMREYLLDFYESLHVNGHVVTPTMIAIELCWKYPEMGADMVLLSILFAISIQLIALPISIKQILT